MHSPMAPYDADTATPGVVITLTGEVLWDPLRLIDNWDNRPATFVADFSFPLTTLGTNIALNDYVLSISI